MSSGVSLNPSMRSRLLRQLVRVAGDIRELNDFVTLVVVPEDEDTVAERREFASHGGADAA